MGKIKERIAVAAVAIGTFLIIGSTGAYENGDYTAWQCIAGYGCGAAFAAAGVRIWKEE